MESAPADLVIGSRFASGDGHYSVGRVRGAVMRRLARMASRRTGVTITDATSGFRAIGPNVLGPVRVDLPGRVPRRHHRVVGARGPGRLPGDRGAGGDAAARRRRVHGVVDLVGLVSGPGRRRGVAPALPADRPAGRAAHPVGGRSGVRIAITGVTGFIGRHLATRALARGSRRDGVQPAAVDRRALRAARRPPLPRAAGAAPMPGRSTASTRSCTSRSPRSGPPMR